MFKKALSLLLALMLIVTSVSITAISVAAAEGDEEAVAVTYYVVGDNAELFTKAGRDGIIDANAMTANEDGTYTKVYEAVGPFEKAVSLKVTNGIDWIGTSNGNDVAIEVFAAGDITVKYDPNAKDDQVTVDGKGVKTIESKVSTVGANDDETTSAADDAATTTAEPTEAEPATEPTEAPAATAAPTAAPAVETQAKAAEEPVADGDQLVVTAKSNITPTYTQSFDPTTNQVTVTYWIQMTEKWMVNGQWTLSYDKEFLTVDMTEGVNGKTNKRTQSFVPTVFYVTQGTGTVVNFDPPSMPEGGIKGNASDINNGFDLCDEGGRVPFVSVTFNPTGKTGNTEVVLDVEIVNVQGVDDTKEDYFIKDSEIVQALSYLPEETPVAVYAGETDPGYVAPEQPTTAAPTTEAPTTTEEPTTTAAPTTTEEPTTTVAPTTEAPTTVASKSLTVKAYSNSDYFKPATQTYNDPEIPEKVTVQFFIDTEAYQMVNGQFELHYDPKVLALKESNNKEGRTSTLTPAATASAGSGIIANWANLETEPVLPINFSNVQDGGIYLTDIEGNALPVISAVFEVVGEGETEVFLDTQIITLNNAGLPVSPSTWMMANKNNEDFENVLTQFSQNADMTFKVLPEATPTPTEAPTTEAPTTEAPTTEAPTTTEEPTTEAPTTEPKPAEDVYVLAGSSNFVSVGWSPDPDSYTMTKGDDGIYTVVVPDVVAEEGALYQVKVVQFVGGDPENSVWHGMDGTDLNVDFMLNSDCDVTVTYNPETGEITVSGDGVIPPVYNITKITAVGAGQGNFLNGIVWNPDAEENQMTEVKPGVYEITFEDCDTNTDYQFKFAANGGWDMNWGLVKETEAKLNEANPSQYNGENILFNVESEEDTFNVTIQLDISNWDTAKKTGATYTIFINREEPTEAPTTEAPTTEAPTTEAPTTEAPTTEAPTTEAPTTEAPTTEAPTTEAPTTAVPTLTVDVKTAVADHVTDKPKDFALVESNPVIANVGDNFTLTWKLDTDGKDLESLQWVFNYDASMELVSAEMNQITSGAYINTEVPGVVKANASNIYGYTVDPNAAFITLTFRAVEPGNASADMTLDEFALVPVIEPTTEAPTTEAPTTEAPTTEAPTTEAPTTEAPTTEAPTTEAPTTEAPTTEAPTTEAPTTEAPTTEAPTTEAPTTEAPTTEAPTTEAPTTEAPTTVAPTTEAPTTTAPATTVAPTTKPKSTSDSATKDSSGNTSNNGTVKTGSASMAVIILLVLVSATAAIYFARRRDRQ